MVENLLIHYYTRVCVCARWIIQWSFDWLVIMSCVFNFFILVKKYHTYHIISFLFIKLSWYLSTTYACGLVLVSSFPFAFVYQYIILHRFILGKLKGPCCTLGFSVLHILENKTYALLMKSIVEMTPLCFFFFTYKKKTMVQANW